MCGVLTLHLLVLHCCVLVRGPTRTSGGSTREVPVSKAPKTYPAEPESVKALSTRELNSRGVAKLRKSIEPGSVLILLAGRFRGRRVVFLKHLASIETTVDRPA